MSRGLSAPNVTEVDAAHLHVVTLVKMQFDAPLFVHSGVGNIVFGGDTYLGVGDLGSVGSIEEGEEVLPSPFTLSLSGIDSNLITEALDAGNFGDIITVYEGYRKDDGTLVDDPWLAVRGFYEHSTIALGDDNVIIITVQNELIRLSEKDGGRYSNEDQQDRFLNDEGFKFVADMVEKKLLWGRRIIGGTGGGGSTDFQGDRETRG